MGAKHWTGLIAIALFASIQVQGSWFNPEPEVAVATADADSLQRDGVTCLTPEDCLTDECCLANVRPIAKRSARTKRWFFETAPLEGVCQRLGTEGSSCIVPSDGIFPDPTKEVIALDVSPCAPEFICVAGSDAETVASQGAIGSCELKPTETEDKDEVLRLLDDKEEDEVATDNNNNDEELTDNDDAPSETDNADNDDNNNDNVDESEPVSEEKEEDEEEKAEEWEEEKPLEEEEKPLDNTIDDFPADSEYDQ